MGVQSNGKPPSILTQAKHDWFDQNFSCQVLSERGVVFIRDEANDVLLTYTQFKKQFGVLGALWLASDRKPVYLTLAAYERARAVRGRCSDGAGGW